MKQINLCILCCCLILCSNTSQAAPLAHLCSQKDLDRGKVNVCHVPPGNPENAHTICVDGAAARRPYEGHFPGEHGGDSLGVCPTPTPTPTPTPDPSPSPTPTPCKKVTICHLTGDNTLPAIDIEIDENALQAHLDHGDQVGTCTFDCAGVPFGQSLVDECGVCGGDNSTCTDCAGTINGEGTIDECGVCNGQSNTCLDCAGTPNGEAVVDECGVCGGDNSTCLDCAGTPNGDAVVDSCGVCNGKNDCVCDWLDSCGVPCGDNSTCKDCAGTPNGNATKDKCDVCDADSTNDNLCLDCAGIPNGGTLVDPCGVCDGDGSSCRECEEIDITDTQFKLDGNSAKQYRVVRSLAKKLKPVVKNTLGKFAQHFHMQNWTLTWTLKSVQTDKCTNDFQCILVDNTSILDEYSANSKELLKLARKAFRKGAKTKKRKKLLQKARKLHRQNLKLVDTVPTQSLDC